jgi:hypothetical protein
LHGKWIQAQDINLSHSFFKPSQSRIIVVESWLIMSDSNQNQNWHFENNHHDKEIRFFQKIGFLATKEIRFFQKIGFLATKEIRFFQKACPEELRDRISSD